MEEIQSASAASRRFNTLMIGLFAFVALALAAAGLYGVISHLAGQRTREIGIRMALGAQPPDVFRLVVGQGMRWTVMGVAIGLAGALGMTQLLETLVFGVSATDPATFIGTALALCAVALLASYLPARRAMRVDPVIALREE
jgi:ABC-type antimicrobial peptide transport system permease subunit